VGNKSEDGNMQKRQQTMQNKGTIVSGGGINISGGNVQLGANSSMKNVNETHPAASESSPIVPAQPQTTAFELFFSYVEKDQKYVDALQIHLTQLVRSNVITNWHGSKLAAGSDRTESIKHFNQASVILLLISPAYMASEYHYEEVARAMERRAKEGIKVIPILVHLLNLQYTPIAGLQPIPRNGKAIAESGKLDTVVYQVAEEIREVIEAMKKERGSS